MKNLIVMFAIILFAGFLFSTTTMAEWASITPGYTLADEEVSVFLFSPCYGYDVILKKDITAYEVALLLLMVNADPYDYVEGLPEDDRKLILRHLVDCREK